MREAAHHTPTRLQFLPDWRTEQHGEITPGGKLVVEYDSGRLPRIRPQQRGSDTCNVEAYIRFHPSDELYKESLVEEAKSGAVARGTAHSLRPLEVTVPKDATQVELWFRTFDDVGAVPEAWDSQFGQNYWFNVSSRQTTASLREHEAAPQPRPEAAPQPRHEAAPQPRHEAAPQPKHEAAPQPKHEVVAEHRHEAAPQPKHEAIAEHRHEAAPQPKHEAIAEPKQSTPDSHPAGHQQNQPNSAKRKRPR